MRRVISTIAGLTSMSLVLFGLITCMCETPDLDKQLTTLLMGLTIMLVGAGFGFISKEVAEW